MRGKREWIIGGILISLGVLIFLNNMGVTDIPVGRLIRGYWPAALIAWGLSLIIRKKDAGGIVTGIIIAAAGAVILGNRQGWFTLNISFLWSVFWPLILILAGISFLRGPKLSGKNNLAFMGGFEKTRDKWELEDSTYWAVMGGIKLDLKKAQLKNGREYNISLNAFMGGIEVTVPDDAAVICRGNVILGGLEFLKEESGGIFSSLEAGKSGANSDSPVINIYCRAVMGGVEVR